jgi:putative ABC transport system permease protein
VLDGGLAGSADQDRAEQPGSSVAGLSAPGPSVLHGGLAGSADQDRAEQPGSSVAGLSAPGPSVLNGGLAGSADQAMNTVALGWPLAALLVALTAGAALIAGLGGLADWRSMVIAGVRALLQLLAVSAVIAVVLQSRWLTAGFLLVMVAVAAATSAHRITGSWRPRSWITVVPILLGVLPVLAAILASGVLPAEPVAILPTAGILIGGAMTATSLAGRRLVEELTEHRGTYEAGLSLGLTRRDAVTVVARPAAGLALVPGLDQTRTVGLVTLPGAFVGMLLAGASPLQAGAVQLLVLLGLLLVQALAVVTVVELVSAGLLAVGNRPLPA